MPEHPAIGVHQLVIEPLFNGLTEGEKLYAHHLSKAAWHGTRIIMRQTSPESPDIFDFIMAMSKALGGEWTKLIDQCSITADELTSFLEFCGLFLYNLGNYFGSGDKKFVPGVSPDCLRRIAGISNTASSILEKIISQIYSIPPHSLGFPDSSHQSTYYPGDGDITRDEVADIAKIMERHQIEPENTRVKKLVEDEVVFEILQASSSTSEEAQELCNSKDEDGPGITVRVVQGDHAEEMSKICSHLNEAIPYATNERQRSLISNLLSCFQSGSQSAYRQAQRDWVLDQSPRIENILGFVESYRDPYGVRAEWEGGVFISDPGETTKLEQLVKQSTKFVRTLPWAVEGENDGKGPFETTGFVAPDFTVVHVLAFCTPTIWDATNLPNYADIRETCGFKNLVYANRMSTYNNPQHSSPWLDGSDLERFRECNHTVRFITTGIHELLGHGSGKLLTETTEECNFDKDRLPINPLTGKPIETWYRPGQSWTGVFEDLANTVEECRATIMSYFLVDNRDILTIFGYDDETPLSAEDIVYNAYLAIGVEGIAALEFYNVEGHTWGQQHRRANYAILRYLLADGGGVIEVEHDSGRGRLRVKVNREKIYSHGKPCLGRMLERIHVWRCIADVKSCKEFYEPLTNVDGVYEEWRRIVAANPEPQWKFVQANTFIEDGNVSIKVYDESNEGIIQSFSERGL